MKLWAIFLLLCLSFTLFAKSPHPNKIQRWWKIKENYQIKKIIEISLSKKETAFLAKVFFNDRQACCQSKLVLIRPKKGQVRELDLAVTNFRVLNLDFNDISEIEVDYVLEGQGYIQGSKKLLYFKAWQPIIIYEGNYSDNTKTGCGYEYHKKYAMPLINCTVSNIGFSYAFLNEDDNLDLIVKQEKITWQHADDKQEENIIKKFVFSNKSLLVLP